MTTPTAMVFVIDDDESVRKSLNRLLDAAHYKTEVFQSASERGVAGPRDRPPHGRARAAAAGAVPLRAGRAGGRQGLRGRRLGRSSVLLQRGDAVLHAGPTSGPSPISGGSPCAVKAGASSGHEGHRGAHARCAGRLPVRTRRRHRRRRARRGALHDPRTSRRRASAPPPPARP